MVEDFLIRIKNAAMAKNKEAEGRLTNKNLAVSLALKRLGFLDDVKKEGNKIKVLLTFKNKRPLMMNLKLVSKPGLRIYKGVSEIEKKKGPSIFLLSSPFGIISGREAIKKRTGGEIIAEIW